jgi:hypothetical protein
MLWTPQKYNEPMQGVKPSTLPVSIEDTGFTESRARNGKMVNVALRIKVAHDYWS